jgi:hypothetical protein
MAVHVLLGGQKRDGDGEVLPGLPDDFSQLDSVDPRHLDIHQDQVGRAGWFTAEQTAAAASVLIVDDDPVMGELHVIPERLLIARIGKASGEVWSSACPDPASGIIQRPIQQMELAEDTRPRKTTSSSTIAMPRC